MGNRKIRLFKLNWGIWEGGFDGVRDHRHVGRTADEEDLIDLLASDVFFLEDAVDAVDGLLDKTCSRGFKFFTGDFKFDGRALDWSAEWVRFFDGKCLFGWLDFGKDGCAIIFIEVVFFTFTCAF